MAGRSGSGEPNSVKAIVPPEPFETAATTVTPATSADGFDWGDAGLVPGIGWRSEPNN
jgi:hypothetical protein